MITFGDILFPPLFYFSCLFFLTNSFKPNLGFTPYNPESPSLQTGDEGNFKSKDK
jgi:hypothetical protein